MSWFWMGKHGQYLFQGKSIEIGAYSLCCGNVVKSLLTRRVCPQKLRHATPGWHRGRSVGGEISDTALRRRHSRKVHRRAEVARVSDGHGANPKNLRFVDCPLHCIGGDDLADTVLTVEHINRRCAANARWLCIQIWGNS